MIKIETLDNRYSTTRILHKLIDDNCLYNGTIKKECKFKISDARFKIAGSKIIGKPDAKFETLLFLPETEGRRGEGGMRKKGYFKNSYKKINGLWFVVDRDNRAIEEVLYDWDKQISVGCKCLKQLPLISIITVVYNGEKYIEETIQSVLKQTYPNVEYIIIDGGSNDNTLNVIKRYEGQIDYWVSEKDSGMYDAMNKAIDLSTGRWINFMNTGDEFFNNKVVEEVFLKKIFKNIDIIYGNIVLNYNNCFIHRKAKSPETLWSGMTIPHQSIFVSTIYHKRRKFPDKKMLSLDYFFLYQAYFNSASFYYIDKAVALFDMTGLSNQNIIQCLDERKNILEYIRKDKRYSAYYFFMKIFIEFKILVKKLLPNKWILVYIKYRENNG